METFGKWLKTQLETQKISQKELADFVGVTPAQVSRIISGDREAGDQTLISIAHALRLPPETVFAVAKSYKPTYTKDDDKDPSLLEWIKLYKDATPEQREIMIENARFFSSRTAQKR